MSMSMMEGYSGFESMTSMTSLTSTPTSLHSKGSLTASYSEHCPQSLPPFTGRSRKCRPMSAPPGKFDLASLAKSLKDQAGPDSPRLSGVVEKEESVAWKIEYNEGEEIIQQQQQRQQQPLSAFIIPTHQQRYNDQEKVL
jgi:hypothetical protein